MAKKDIKPSTIRKMSKEKKVELELGDMDINLIDVEPIISQQKKDREGRELGEIHLPDLSSLKNRL